MGSRPNNWVANLAIGAGVLILAAIIFIPIFSKMLELKADRKAMVRETKTFINLGYQELANKVVDDWAKPQLADRAGEFQYRMGKLLRGGVYDDSYQSLTYHVKEAMKDWARVRADNPNNNDQVFAILENTRFGQIEKLEGLLKDGRDLLNDLDVDLVTTTDGRARLK
ncbi:MAG: hypothetical protein WA057_06930, partial [Candidatus Magasanikiibacteriota bacterium]